MGRLSLEEQLEWARTHCPDLVVRPDRRKRRIVAEHDEELAKVRREVAEEVFRDLVQNYIDSR